MSDTPSSQTLSSSSLSSGALKPIPAPTPVNISDQEYFKTSAPAFNLEDFPDSETVVRRHSVSLTNRTPPRFSLAADILNSRPLGPRVESHSSLLASITDLQEQLSEFNSCQEELSDSSSTNSGDETQHQELPTLHKSANEKKRERRRKRKLAVTPGKEQFLKKQNTQSSPQ